MKILVISKKQLKKKLRKSFTNGYDHGYDAGYLQAEIDAEQQIIGKFQERVRLLNPDFPVTVAELRKWVGLDD